MTANILIIDDLKSNRDYLKVLLGQYFSVIEAVNGKEGLALCLEHRPKLIICDILMPEMDGYKFVSEVRRIPEICDTTVIFLTAHFNDAEAYQLAHKAGVLNIITKPCDPENLLRKVKEAMVNIAYMDTDIQSDEYRLSHEQLLTNKLVKQSQELFHSREQIANLIELNLNLASQKDVSELLAIVCHGARELLEADTAVLIVQEKTNDQIAQCSISGIEADIEDVIIDSGIFASVFKNRETKRIHSGELHLPGEVGLPAQFPEFYALLAVPVVSLSRSYGWLCLTRNSDRGFTDEDELMLSILAAQTGRIYENGSLYMKVRHHAEKLEQEIRLRNQMQLHLTIQYESGRLLSYASDIDEALPGVLSLVGEALGFAAARVWQYDEEKSRVYCNQEWFRDETTSQENHQNAREMESRGILALLNNGIEPNTTVWIEDITVDKQHPLPDEQSRQLLNQYSMRGLVAIPILVDSMVTGVLLLRSHDALSEDREIHNVLKTVSSQIGFYTERMQHRESIENLNRLYTVLSSFNNAIVLSENRLKLIQVACDIAVTDGKFQLAWVACFDEEMKQPQVMAMRTADDLDLPINSLEDMLSSNDDVSQQLRSQPLPIVRNRLRQHELAEAFCTLDNIAVSLQSQSYTVLSVEFPDASNCVLVLTSDEPDFFDEKEMILVEELAADLTYALRNLDNQRKLNYLAYHDPVTHLMNRNSFISAIEKKILQHHASAPPFFIAVMSINHFRQINDSLGYKIGEELLYKVGARIQKVLGQHQLLASVGEKDFALLIADAQSVKDGEEFVLDILHLVNMTYQLADIPVNVEMTAGLAFYQKHGDSPELLLQNADAAFRHAKASGRKYHVYDPQLGELNSKNLALAGELRGAIERDEFYLVYQPKIDLSSMKVTGVEALIRWQHPELGRVNPDSFIPLVEQTDLINDLTFWVLRRALNDIQEWERKGFALEVSVNMSVRSLMSPEFARSVREMVEANSIDLDKLILEITESAVMTDPAGAKQTILALHEVGVRFALDDFGTGHSSLVYLKDLPVEKLKIDKSFIVGIGDPKNSAIVHSAIELGHNLGLRVIGEGIEHEEALRILKDFDCDQGQGFYFSKGLPSGELIDWVKTSEWGQPV